MKPAKQKKFKIQFETLMKASFLFEAAINPMRQQLLNSLLEEERLTSASLCHKLGFEQELCVQQLSILCGIGLLLREKENKEVFYRVRYEKLHQLYMCALAILE